MSWSKEFTLGGESKRHESKLFFQNFTNLLIIGLLAGAILAGAWQWRSAGPLKRHYVPAYSWSYWFTAHPGKPKSTKKELVLVKDVSNYWLPVGDKPKDKEIPYRMATAGK